MRNKKSFALGILLLCLTVGYTGYWFYSASLIKQRAEEGIEKMVLPNNGRILTYSKTTLSGYPFKVKVSFKDVIVRFPYINNIELATPQVTLAKSIFSHQSFDVVVNDAIETRFYEELAGKRVLKTTLFDKYESSPVFTLSFEGKPFPVHISYHDAGSTTQLRKDGEILITRDKNILDINIAEKANDMVSVNFDLKSGPSYINTALRPDNVPAIMKPTYLVLSKMGPLTNSLNFEAEFPRDIKKAKGIPPVSLKIHEFKSESSQFSNHLSGEIHTVSNELFPVGNVALEIKNFPLLLEMIGANAASATNTPNTSLSVDTAKYDQFVRRLVVPKGQAPLSGINLSLSIKRDPMKQTVVNDKTIPEVITLFEEVFGTQAAPAQTPKPEISVTPGSVKAQPQSQTKAGAI